MGWPTTSGRAGPVAGRRAARRPGADRHQARVQRGRVRRRARCTSTARGQLVPGPRRGGGGPTITTIEGLAMTAALDPFRRRSRPFRVPVRLLHARDDHDREGVAGREPASPTEDEIRQAIRGNLCRCTGYAQDRRGHPGRVRTVVKVREYRPSGTGGRHIRCPATDCPREGHRQGRVRLRHAPVRHGLRRDPAQPAPARPHRRHRHGGGGGDPRRPRRLHAGRHAAEQVRRVRAGRDRAGRRGGALPGRGRRRRHRRRRADRPAWHRGDRRGLRVDAGRVRSRGGDGRGRSAAPRRRRAQRRRA